MIVNAEREAYLKLASDLEGFLTQLHAKAELSTVDERQRVLRLLVKDVLVGPDKITISHRIPIRKRATDNAKPAADADTEDDHAGHCPLRWGREFTSAVERRAARAGGGRRDALCVPRLRVRGNKTRLPGRDQIRDDLVALCHTGDQAEQIKAGLAEWLAPKGLRFNEDKRAVGRRRGQSW